MKLHLIAIGGTGMGSLAGLLAAAGHEVRGSDEHVYPPMSDQLAALGIPVCEGYRPENLDWEPDRVVVGNVCRRDHVEVAAAQARGLALTSFPAILEELFLRAQQSLVVAGTHGKTTTASLLAHVLTDAGRDPSFLVGGVPVNFGRSFRLGAGTNFVVEGDEYDTAFFDKKSKFLHYRPRSAILTSVELDHVDIFRSFDEVKAAFRRFVDLIPESGLLVAAASSPDVLAVAEVARCRVETYAVGTRALGICVPTWHAEVQKDSPPTRTTFLVRRDGEFFGTFDMAMAGEHNVENALAVVALASSLGLSSADIVRALARFTGVKRRQELRGVAAGVSVIDDYAHHPTAIRETLLALRRRVGRGRLLAVYEPRSATSRRSTFQREFAAAFALADEVIVAKLHAPDGIPPAERFDPERLASDLRGHGTAARMIPEVDAIVAHVAESVQPGDCVAVFSSGGFGGIHRKLLSRLGDALLPAGPEHLARIREILALTKLEPDALEGDRVGDVTVVEDETGVVGCVALEVHDDAAILHSLAVVPDHRGRGLGWMLADSAVGRARAAGARRLYLFTERASELFAEKLGFHVVERAIVDRSIAGSRHFRAAPKSAVAMRLDL